MKNWNVGIGVKHAWGGYRVDVKRRTTLQADTLDDAIEMAKKWYESIGGNVETLEMKKRHDNGILVGATMTNEVKNKYGEDETEYITVLEDY